MKQLHKLIATFGGIGYIGKGGGSIAAAVFCVLWYFFPVTGYHGLFTVLIAIAICTFGTWSSNVVDAFWGKDSSKVVIDEVAGMIITLLFVPVQWKYLLAGFILFRFFDIVKPLYIRRMEQLPKGWGVMADDYLAGIYARALMQVLIATKILE
jgi:phosphatidylglycerophosphatase A